MTRIPADGTTPATEAPVVSPTGAPWVPVKLVPWIAGACAASEALALYLPADSVPSKVFHIVAIVCGIALGTSPGLRKK